MFACLGSSELLLVSLAGLAYGLIYKDTVGFFAGFVFLVMAGLVAVEVFLAVYVYFYFIYTYIFVNQIDKFYFYQLNFSKHACTIHYYIVVSYCLIIS